MPVPYVRLALILLIGVAWPVAAAGAGARGQFSVGATVLPRYTDQALLQTLPLPANSWDMAAGRDVRQIGHSGPLEEVRAFYAQELAARGFRLVNERAGAESAEQVWQQGRARVVIQLEAALGMPTTRIRLFAERRSDADVAP